MSINPLNEISKVYLEQVVAHQVDCVTEVSADLALKASKEAGKRAGILAGLSGGDPKVAAKAKKKRAQAERLYSKQAKKRVVTVSPIKEEENVVDETSHLETDMKKRREANEKAVEDMKKTSSYKTMATAAAKKFDEALDPVGKEDKDVDNDGDHDKSDKYLLNRRKVRGAAISKRVTKESFSNWREELSEVVGDISKDKNDEKIVEKNVNNKIKINPNIGEAVEELGGTLLEMVEIDEIDYVLESAYDELIEEGYDEDDVEDALEFALTEAKVTYGHDTSASGTEKKKQGLLSVARKRLSGIKKTAKQAVATGARKVAKGALKVARKVEGGDKTPSAAHTATRKSSTYRGAGVGQKERVSSGSYQAPTKKKAEPVEDPWKGSETTPMKAKAKKPSVAKPKAATKKTTAKKKRTSKLDDLLASVRSEEVQIDEKVLTSAETKKKEELVKKMKKSAADFEERYPGRGKEVMYATATKMAKRMVEQALELQPKTQTAQNSDQQQKKLQQQRDRMKQQEVQILQRKLQAMKSAPKGVDPSITT